MESGEEGVSSRPKTSSGRPGTSKRPKTAGRNSDRPATRSSSDRRSAFGVINSSGSGGSAERAIHALTPESGHSVEMSPDEITVERPIYSRAGVVSRIGNRLATAGGPGAQRPITASRAVPPGTGMQRPVTQQGLSGARLATRAGTAFGSRLVMDKTYFTGLLNTQLASLTDEIQSLENEMLKFEQEQQKLLLYEQKAEEIADEIKNMQGTLSDYNLIIDRQNTNSDLNTLQYELQEMRKSNEEVQAAIEEMFRERREKEDVARTIEAEVAEIRAANEDLMHSLDPGIRDEYARVKAEAEHLAEELEVKQVELEELVKKKEALDIALASNPLKQQAMVLQEQIAELEAKKQDLHDQLNSNDAPDILRRKFMEDIKQDNIKIESMTDSIQDFEAREAQAKEELLEFENEYDIVAGEKSEKYRELKAKEAQIDEFLRLFESTKAKHNDAIKKLGEQAENLLLLISKNCPQDEPSRANSAVDNLKSAVEKASTAEQLQNVHLQLQIELQTISETEDRLNEEWNSVTARQKQMKEELKTFGDVQGLQGGAATIRQSLVDRREQLNTQLPRLEREVLQLRDEVDEYDREMTTNVVLQKLVKQKHLLNAVKQEYNDLEQQIQAKSRQLDYSELKSKAMKLRADYNAMLISMSSSGHSRS